MFYTFSLCWTNVGYKVLQLYTHDSTHDRSYHIMDKAWRWRRDATATGQGYKGSSCTSYPRLWNDSIIYIIKLIKITGKGRLGSRFELHGAQMTGSYLNDFGSLVDHVMFARIGDKYLGKSPKNKPSPPFGGLEPLTTVLQLSNRPNHPSHEWPWLGIETHGDLGIHQAFRTPYSYLFFPMIWLRKHEKKTSHVHVWWPRTSSWPLALDLLCSMGRWAVRPNTVRPKRLGESGKVW